MANPPLSLGYGYGIVLGLGFVYAFGVYLQITKLLKPIEILTAIRRFRNDVDNMDSQEVRRSWI